ncbi:MAG: Rpn family recombination-promoting nuclease/putative transposase, partial [Oscillospiraceae bacterium]|nr:Rpn family recombination-promoting nuclease/putative transposase [Oscillospiraceae bacterium]
MKITINRADPFDDTMATAIFHHKDWAGDWILETINTAVADGGGLLWLEELLELNTQQIVIPQSDARYVKLDIYAIAVNNGRRVYVNVEIQLENTIIMTDRSFLHLADILNRYSQDLKGASTVDFYKGFPYLIAINLLDYVIPEISGDVHEVIKLCDVNTGKPATDKVEIHNIQLPQLTSENFDP